MLTQNLHWWYTGGVARRGLTKRCLKPLTSSHDSVSVSSDDVVGVVVAVVVFGGSGGVDGCVDLLLGPPKKTLEAAFVRLGVLRRTTKDLVHKKPWKDRNSDALSVFLSCT